MFKNDYIMKKISNIIRFIARLIFNKSDIEYEFPQDKEYSKVDYLYRDILRFLDEGDINRAEDLLFENIDKSSKEYLRMVLDFYSRLNEFTDEELEKSGFSRLEIEEGLVDMAGKLNINLLNLK